MRVVVFKRPFLSIYTTSLWVRFLRFSLLSHKKLEEDLEKERFFAFARRTYWESPEASARRALMQTLIGKLDF